MRLDTQPLLLIAARLAAEGHLEADTYERRRATLCTMEERLVTKQQHVEVHEESRSKLALDGTATAWERWKTEHYLLTFARSEVQRLESHIRLELELLEREVALAEQRRARAIGLHSTREARA